MIQNAVKKVVTSLIVLTTLSFVVVTRAADDLVQTLPNLVAKNYLKNRSATPIYSYSNRLSNKPKKNYCALNKKSKIISPYFKLDSEDEIKKIFGATARLNKNTSIQVKHQTCLTSKMQQGVSSIGIKFNF